MTVFLIGGGAGVGKTTAARALTSRVGAGWLQLDTVWLAVSAAATPARRRLLRVDDAIRRAAGEGSTDLACVRALVDQHIEAARALAPALATAIWFEHETHGHLVVDGSWVVPGDVAALRDAVGGDLRVVYAVESDRDALQEALDSRRAGRPAQRHHRLVGDVVFGYGSYLGREAKAHGIPVIPARPYATQAERTASALGVG